MSQFMLCKSAHDLTVQKCAKIMDYEKENERFLSAIAKSFFDDKILHDIWVVPHIHTLFDEAITQKGTLLFENTELHFLLAALSDMSEELILWYSNDYQDLDNVTTKEEFLDAVKTSLDDSMCECYVHMKMPESSEADVAADLKTKG